MSHIETCEPMVIMDEIDDEIEIVKEILIPKGYISPASFLSESKKVKKIDWDDPDSANERLPRRPFALRPLYRMLHSQAHRQESFFPMRPNTSHSVPRRPFNGRIEKNRSMRQRVAENYEVCRSLAQMDISDNRLQNTSSPNQLRQRPSHRSTTHEHYFNKPSSAEMAAERESNSRNSRRPSQFSAKKFTELPPPNVMDIIRVAVPIPKSPIPAPPSQILDDTLLEPISPIPSPPPPVDTTSLEFSRISI